MKKLVAILLTLLCISNAVADTDYSSYSTDELLAMDAAIQAELKSRKQPTEESPEDDFEIVTNGIEARVRSYKGSASNVVIPSEYDGCPVTSIGDKAFYGNTTLVNVYIPGSVNNVGTSAFGNCHALETVTFGDSTGRLIINEGAFKDTSYYKPFLKKIEFSHTPYSSLVIGDSALYCTAVEGVLVIKAKQLRVERIALGGLDVTGIIILADNIWLGDRALFMGNNLKYIYMPSDASLALYTGFKGAFSELPICDTILLPDRVTGLREKSFSESPKITVYCTEESNAVEACQSCFIPVNTKGYQHKQEELLEIAVSMGYVR